MNSLLQYILEVSCVFTVLYVVYYLILRQLTFHTLNRAFLLLSIPLSLLLPVLSIGLGNISITHIDIPKFEEYISTEQSTALLNPGSGSNFNPVIILMIFYCSGLIIFIWRLFKSVFQIIKIRQESQVEYTDRFVIISANIPAIFSCFNWIFVPENGSCKYEDPVLEHEKGHALCWHTIDLIITEFFIALLWFHPFVFFFRRSIKSVHEFQVDSRILQSNTSKWQYLKLILENLDSKQRVVGLYSYFNSITIKNRVKMITKNKSHKYQLIRYLFLVPVITILAMSFTKPIGAEPEIFPIKEGDYSVITVHHGEKMINPFTNKETVHNGIDIKAKEGVSVMAVAEGKVIKVSTEKGWGKMVVIDHGGGFETWYAHLKDFTVEYGQKVSKGQIIGHVGNTGYSTGPHLHYEVRLDNKSVDPMDYIAK